MLDGKGKSYHRSNGQQRHMLVRGNYKVSGIRSPGPESNSALPPSKGLFPRLKIDDDDTNLTVPFYCCFHEIQSDKLAGLRNAFQRPVTILVTPSSN